MNRLLLQLMKSEIKRNCLEIESISDQLLFFFVYSVVKKES